mgnify:CR=1 FL=1
MVVAAANQGFDEVQLRDVEGVGVVREEAAIDVGGGEVSTSRICVEYLKYVGYSTCKILLTF